MSKTNSSPPSASNALSGSTDALGGISYVPPGRRPGRARRRRARRVLLGGAGVQREERGRRAAGREQELPTATCRAGRRSRSTTRAPGGSSRAARAAATVPGRTPRWKPGRTRSADPGPARRRRATPPPARCVLRSTLARVGRFRERLARCGSRSSGTPNGSGSARSTASPPPATSRTRPTTGRSRAAGGAVAAVQLARLGGLVRLLHGARRRTTSATASTPRAHRARRRRARAASRDDRTRRALTLVDPAGERTITTLGRRLAPCGDDPLPWDRLDGADAVYVTAGDAEAFRRARRARVMVVTTRVLDELLDADVVPDALVGSDRDPCGARRRPRCCRGGRRCSFGRRGASGGRYETASGEPVATRRSRCHGGSRATRTARGLVRRRAHVRPGHVVGGRARARVRGALRGGVRIGSRTLRRAVGRRLT